jgi:membrane-bound inhibitor of C-type lysozyme
MAAGRLYPRVRFRRIRTGTDMTLRLLAGLAGCSLLATGCAPYTGGLTKPPLNTIYRVALVRYDCKSGAHIKVSYSSKKKTAVVVYKGQSHPMHRAHSANGARYIGDHLEWWIKGSGEGKPGTLFHHRNNGQTGDVIQSCYQVTMAQ